MTPDWSVVKLQFWVYGQQRRTIKRRQKMKPTEYLDAAKARLNVKSDYALAKLIECPSGHIAEVRSGKRHVPLDMAFRLAITLEIDPAQVVADLEEQREKNEKRRGFWRSFRSHAACAALALACMLAVLHSATSGSGPGARGGAFRRPRYCT